MNLTTTEGDALDENAILPEYPRPQLVRDSYLNLNGRWQYAIRARVNDETEPTEWDGPILVPFSPESALSGVNRQLTPDQTLWYRRELDLPAGFNVGRLLLHFGAVDSECEVFLDGESVGSHVGGYLPFSIDVTDAIGSGRATLTVAVHDASDTVPASHGKQKLDRGGIWYTAQSGIWQTVWLESVPDAHIERLQLTPQLEAGAVEVTVISEADAQATVVVTAGGQTVAEATVQANSPTRIPLGDVRPWSPEDPFLYDIRVTLGTDEVTSYVGMRSFGTGTDADGVPRLLLNGKPYFHAGVLDQGYWPDGLYTAPSDDALIADIRTMKDLGFTMLRKHIKIEPLRWYAHCDRIGILVWQDMVNGGAPYRPAVITLPAATPVRFRDDRYDLFGRADAAGRAEFRRELHETIELLSNVVSIAMWVPFNEGWGQFDAQEIADEVRALDPTRTIDHASGWHDQGAGDVKSLHVYIRPFRMRRSWREDGRVVVLSEYGGYSYREPGHAFSDKEFGYRRYRSHAELDAAFERLHDAEVIPAVGLGLAATVYTQLSDVEDELNGILTYDRRIVKLTPDVVRRVNARLTAGNTQTPREDPPADARE
ncbi:glycoside hydrolase family 2 protein [Mycetocola zhujimingii]|uniref:glycoside hydrolase family 2 protein n=1 Tax=Mycetocola zhujimingii TaxID=2079792 RepID=UPI000D3ADB20|nr:sugar-binding domain-containing protein [Mycetocola zhujimingii]AWB85883.1 glycoside hydrolase family 2 [Mycetocola zhujimingii]